MLNCQAVY